MTVAELLAQHAPYLSKRSNNKLCLRCLDTKEHGEFDTVDAWARHVALELKRAGMVRGR
jgi:hypothetical protein